MADDFIRRDDALKLLHKNWGKYGTSTEAFEATLHQYRIIPAADVAPVVLCKDCKSCNTDIAVGGWYGICAFWNGHSVMADDYCSRFRNKNSADTREVDDED